eukprot:g17895.t1
MIFEFTQTGGAVASAKIITDDATYEPWGPMKSFQDIKVKKVGFRPHRGVVYIPTGELPIPEAVKLQWRINGVTVVTNDVKSDCADPFWQRAEKDGEEVYKCGGVGEYVWASTDAEAITSVRVRFSMNELEGSAFVVALENQAGTDLQLGLDGAGKTFFRANLPGDDGANPSCSSEPTCEATGTGPSQLSPPLDVTQPMIFEFTQTGGAVASAKIITDAATYEPWGPMNSFQETTVKRVGFRPHRGVVYIPTGELPIPGRKKEQSRGQNLEGTILGSARDRDPKVFGCKTKACSGCPTIVLVASNFKKSCADECNGDDSCVAFETDNDKCVTYNENFNDGGSKKAAYILCKRVPKSTVVKVEKLALFVANGFTYMADNEVVGSQKIADASALADLAEATQVAAIEALVENL